MSKPVAPYTPVVRVGEFAFCSGQIGLSDGTLVESFENQVRQALLNLKTILEAEGLDLTDVVKANLYLVDMANYAIVNQLYAEAFDDHKPARAAVGVASLPLGAQFEIEAVAYG